MLTERHRSSTEHGTSSRRQEDSMTIYLEDKWSG
jgi:hypothetical protein